MNPAIRFGVILAALAGALMIGRAAWPLVESNLTALKSWTRTDGEVTNLAGPVEFEVGEDPFKYRASVDVEHMWGLRIFTRAPLFVDPGDVMRIKPAGFLQMWLSPAGLLGLVLLLLVVAGAFARVGTGERAPHGGWMFTEAPQRNGGAVVLHSPPRQWKIVLGWSILGLAMAIPPLFGPGGNLVSRYSTSLVGAAFTASLWIYSWHTKTLEISADSNGVRMTSVLGWQDVPWRIVRGLEDQTIFQSYYDARMRMWKLPFPGSSVKLYAFTDDRGRTLMSFSPEAEPKGSVEKLFDLCLQQTGLIVKSRRINVSGTNF
jgi:hypothetical protein